MKKGRTKYYTISCKIYEKLKLINLAEILCALSNNKQYLSSNRVNSIAFYLFTG